MLVQERTRPTTSASPADMDTVTKLICTPEAPASDAPLCTPEAHGILLISPGEPVEPDTE